jgi:PAS domain S-box-containing protein
MEAKGKRETLSSLRKKAEKKLQQQTDRLKELSILDLQHLVHELGTSQIELKMQNEELRTAREELEASRSKYFEWYDYAPVGYLTFDTSGLIQEANLAAAKLLESERSFLINKAFSLFIADNDRDIFQAHLSEVVKKGSLQTCELKLRKENERTSYIQLQSSIVKDDKDVVRLWSAVGSITERKLTEEAVRREKVITDAILASVPGLLYLYDDQGFLVRWNKQHEEMTGYSAEEHSHMHVLDWFRGDEKATALIAAGVQRTFQHGYAAIEADLKTKSGTTIPFYFTGVRLSIDGKDYFVGIGIDITERKRAEEALRQSEEKYRALFEESKDAIFISTPEGRYLDMNPAGLEMFGYSSRDELFKIDICQEIYVNPEEREKFLNILNEKGFVKDYEVEMKRKDGTKLTVLSTTTAVRNEGGEIVAYRGIRRDITEHKRLEQQLMQAQKMEVVGQLAGGIAHDFNNILTAIIGYGHLLQMKVSDNEAQGAYIEQILEAANRAAEITDSLLAFSRKQLINSRPVNINDSIRRIEKLISRLIGEDIEVSIALDVKEIICMADPGQIEQVLLNLATNARDAMLQGGKLTISTGLMELDDAFIQAHGRRKPGTYARISVADTGIGMAQEMSEKIFEPFFTTKETGKGTGLGLAVVYGIIKQHDGFINVYSEPGKGTTFHMYLPATTSEDRVLCKPTTKTLHKGGTETILVAEDDERLRKLYEIVLTHSGYKVIMAEDGQDAIAKFIENGDRIQLAILDMIMPKKSGKEAYDEILKIRPEIKVIFASGHTADRIGKDGLIMNNINLITKPASPKDLLKMVREVLDR